MPLEQGEILQILKSKSPDWINQAKEYNTKLSALVNGDDFKGLLSKVEHIEKSSDKWEARKKYSRSIKDLNSRLLRPIDNVFSATGGSKFFNVKSEKLLSDLTTNINKCVGNKSLRKWMSTIWKTAYITDPQGITFIEASKDGTKAYPTYKSIQSIQNYKASGQRLKWICFDAKQIEYEGKTIYVKRIVDDQWDYTFEKNGDHYTLIQELTFSHIFGNCPGIINGDDTKIGTELRLSLIDDIIEIQEEYLRDQSILTIVKFLNGFKNLVRPKVICRSCHGLKKQGDKNCTSCNGTGYMINRDVTDEIVIPIDMNNPDQQLPKAGDIATWIGLDVETWNKYREELQVLEILMYEAIWGTHMTNQENNTATAKFIDTQPVINRLNMIADNAEYIEWSVIELLANFYIPTKNKEDSASNVNYGRRFIIDPPDELLKVYNDSRQKGASITILDKQFNEYLTAKHRGDEESLRYSLIKSRVEPYLHYSIKEVFDYFGQSEAQKKVLFKDFWETLTTEQIEQGEETLKVLLNNYINERNDSSDQEEVTDNDERQD